MIPPIAHGINVINIYENLGVITINFIPQVLQNIVVRFWKDSLEINMTYYVDVLRCNC